MDIYIYIYKYIGPTEPTAAAPLRGPTAPPPTPRPHRRNNARNNNGRAHDPHGPCEYTHKRMFKYVETSWFKEPGETWECKTGFPTW